MSGEQALVGAAGLGLVAANLWRDRSKWSGLFGQGATTDSAAAAKRLGVEVLGAGALVVIAGTGDTASKTALAILGALWVLFLINNAQHPGAPMGKHWSGWLPGDGSLLPPPGQGKTNTTLPPNTIPMPGMP